MILDSYFDLVQDTFTAIASDSGAVFLSIDLTEGEWYDYDEKESREVSVTDLEFKIVQTKQLLK